MQNQAQQKEFFLNNGYVVVDNILSPAQLEELRTMVDGVLNGTVKPQSNPNRNDFRIQWEPSVESDSNVPRHEKIRIVFDLCHTHPFFWQHATRPEILDVVENLLGPDLKLYTDQLFVKPPHHGSEVPYHQDHAYWSALEPHSMLSCWLALDEATVENGCVHVVPGTHRRLLPHHEFEGPQSLGLLESEVDVAREIPVEIKAGGAMFHHSCLTHRSSPNRSDKGRRGLVSIYLPATLRFVVPWDFPYGWKLVRGKEYDGCV